MKRLLLTGFLLLGFIFPHCNRLESKESSPAKNRQSLYLTIQAENGSIRQRLNKDGSYTVYIYTRDLIRVASIRFNGKDLTSDLMGNKVVTPVLTKNSTLEVQFDSTSMYTDNSPIYNTIAAY
jgi:hypothetical protein